MVSASSMSGFIHPAFDVVAVLFALLAGYRVYRWRLITMLPVTSRQIDRFYFLYLGLGSVTGAYFFGTANLWLAGETAAGRSILGAVAGATLMVELYKWRRNIRGSTGYLFVVPLSVCIIVGRLGCFFSGLQDFTHGVPAELPWAWDFGDGVSRHPVQLYESLSMALFLSVFLALLKFTPEYVISSGYYLFAGFYAAQRFVWEFLKPYPGLILDLNIFQLLCLPLLAYAVSMMLAAKHATRYESEVA